MNDENEVSYSWGYEKGYAQAIKDAAKVAWCHTCDSRCKDLGLGPFCSAAVCEDIKKLSRESR